MSVDQLPARVREFVNYLDGLMARLDQGDGWCGVFWQRDPEGMRACLDGREMPPWDVVESLLHDLAAQYGPGGADPETERARALHAAALAAYDARPGAREALGDRLDGMLREQRYATERQTELGRLLASATSREEADAIRLDLAWARDDHERATSRCAELRTRAADLDHRAARARGQAVLRDRVGDGDGFRAHGGGEQPAQFRLPFGGVALFAEHAVEAVTEGLARAGTGVVRGEGGQYAASTSSTCASPLRPSPRSRTSAPTPKQRKRRRGGARFAGMVEEESAPVVVPPTEAPVLPTLPAQADRTGRTPRGARFAGAEDGGSAASAQSWAEPLDPVARQEVAATVGALVRLRGEGRSGEAHVLLVEAAYWPAARFPLLAAEMQRAGLGADWATLLWEAASLPAERLVAAADALTAAGRAEDGEQILRQGVSRPAPEIGQAVLGLAGEGRRREVRALLDAYVRVRTPEEAARSVAPDPRTLVPLLLEAAQGVSDECQWDLVHALRVAGFTA
ncbi:hypothetical protein EAO75_16715 [Streptomyces sp. uw30]|uniref:hypothetical protein n=1 Tax=Streptomyces sp. uw30 TaxID=1828179 RepID=UPI0011CD622A|nr:hypothetical protein [Streptomyces sp. uw30]TXS48566.1 hypothetical protein EAO75_16715 [Streptomyces sp. uw30]